MSVIQKSSATLKCLSLSQFRHSKLLLEQASLQSIQKLDLRPMGSEDRAIWDLLERVETGNLSELKWRSSLPIAQTRGLEVLSRLAGSLQRLNIAWNMGPNGSEHPFNFPTCPALTHLEVKELHVDALNWRDLPNLACVKFQRIRCDFNVDPSRIIIVSSLSARKISYRGDSMDPDDPFDMGTRMVDIFWKLFQRFPKAKAWKIHHKHVLCFCKAVKMTSLRRKIQKFSVYLCSRKYLMDIYSAYLEDRNIFSLLPALLELEELVLENHTCQGLEMKLAEIDFSKLLKLKCLKVYNYDPTQEECAALRSIPKVVMVSSRSKSKWGDAISSMPNVEFRQVSSIERSM